jgi:hypothetical protein
MNDKLERMWKELVVAKFKVLSWDLSGSSEKTHEKPLSG